MTRKEVKQFLPIMRAFANGKEIEIKCEDGVWRNILRFRNFLEEKTFNYSCTKNICSKECFALDILKRRKK